MILARLLNISTSSAADLPGVASRSVPLSRSQILRARTKPFPANATYPV